MLVVDASAALALLASEEGIEPLTSHRLVAPPLLWSEVTSVLNEMRRRREISDALADVAFERLVAAPIGRRSGAELYRRARAVARRLGWAKTYDAEYVALAGMVDGSLLTLDGRLRRGAGHVVTMIDLNDLIV